MNSTHTGDAAPIPSRAPLEVLATPGNGLAIVNREIQRLGNLDESPEQIARLADFKALQVLMLDHCEALGVVERFVEYLETGSSYTLERASKAAVTFKNRSNSRRGIVDRFRLEELDN